MTFNGDHFSVLIILFSLFVTRDIQVTLFSKIFHQGAPDGSEILILRWTTFKILEVYFNVPIIKYITITVDSKYFYLI